MTATDWKKKTRSAEMHFDLVVFDLLADFWVIPDHQPCPPADWETHQEYATRTRLNLATPGPSPPTESAHFAKTIGGVPKNTFPGNVLVTSFSISLTKGEVSF